jgi:hypothetical protein
MKNEKIRPSAAENFSAVIIQKPDLDTCLTGLILGANAGGHLFALSSIVPQALLATPAVLCIEAGGSGQTALNNFAHHDPDYYFPPA